MKKGEHLSEKMTRLLISTFAILTVVSLLGIEIISFRQYNAERTSRRWVNNTYDVIEQIETLGRTFRYCLELPASKVQGKIADQLNAQLTKLLSVTSDNVAQQFTLQELQKKLSHPVFTNEFIAEIWSSVSELKQRELILLESQRTEEQRAASKSNLWIVLSACATGGLLFLTFALAEFIYRSRRRVEAGLTETLQTLMKTNGDLVLLNSRKNNQLKDAVHDLKNPLGSIAGFAELIGEEASGNPSVLEMIAVVKRISQQTLELVGGILDESAANDGPTVFAKCRFAVTDCLQEAVSIMQASAKSKSQSIVLSLSSGPLGIDGDYAKLRDAFMNLIGNALKFSPPSTTVRVDYRCEGSWVKVEIKDEGPGINSKDREKLFQRGQCLSARPTGNEVSTGLGLSIVKDTIEKHLGHVFFDSSSTQKGS